MDLNKDDIVAPESRRFSCPLCCELLCFYHHIAQRKRHSFLTACQLARQRCDQHTYRDASES